MMGGSNHRSVESGVRADQRSIHITPPLPPPPPPIHRQAHSHPSLSPLPHTPYLTFTPNFSPHVALTHASSPGRFIMGLAGLKSRACCCFGERGSE